MQNKNLKKHIIVIILLSAIIVLLSIIFSDNASDFALTTIAKNFRLKPVTELFGESHMPVKLKENTTFEDIEYLIDEEVKLYFYDSVKEISVKVGRSKFDSSAIIKTSSWREERDYIIVEGEDISSLKEEDTLSVLVGGYKFDKAKIGDKITVVVDGESYLATIKGKIEGVNYYALKRYKAFRSVVILPDCFGEVSKEKFKLTTNIEKYKIIIPNLDIDIEQTAYSYQSHYLETHANKKDYELLYIALASIVSVAIMLLVTRDKSFVYLISSAVAGIIAMVITAFVIISQQEILYYLQRFVWQFMLFSGLIWLGAHSIAVVVSVCLKKRSKGKKGTDNYEKLY